MRWKPEKNNRRLALKNIFVTNVFLGFKRGAPEKQGVAFGGLSMICILHSRLPAEHTKDSQTFKTAVDLVDSC